MDGLWRMLTGLSETHRRLFLRQAAWRALSSGIEVVVFGVVLLRLLRRVLPLVLLGVAVPASLPMLALAVRRRSWAAPGRLESHLGGPTIWTGGLYGLEGSFSACLLGSVLAALMFRSGSLSELAPPRPS